MSVRPFLVALAVQAAMVAGAFAVLLALPLPEGFFRAYGFVAGPAVWVLCSLFTARVLRLGSRATLVATLTSGLAAGFAGVALTHSAGIGAGLGVFAGVAARTGARK